MRTFRGKSVFSGIAIGKIYLYREAKQRVRREHIDDPDAELARYQGAREAAISQLGDLYQNALREIGEANAAIFEIHQMMLRDDGYNKSVENIIRKQQVNAEYAVASAGDDFSRMFAAMDDEYMRGRAADVKDISERVIRNLGGENVQLPSFDEPGILVADDLAPSETVMLDKDKVLSFVTVRGSVNSHTAILARTLGIPALIGTELSLDGALDGHIGIVDGKRGEFIADPDDVTLKEYRKLQQTELEHRELLMTLKGRENITLDGKRIKLYANIGNTNDLAAVLENDADGIGLFRSEFLYLERDTFPTEEEQFQIYRNVAETMTGRQVIVRTLDIGADKKCDYFGMEPEENPAMGCRAIRICLTRPEIFRTQLRALLRASACGNLAIMYPMIISVSEVRQIKEIVRDVERELTKQGIAFGHPAHGIMIETPAAVMMSEELAQEVDFFSIGTNDLTQYTLAIDRQNPKLDAFYDAHHPAVLRMIEMTIANAHKAGIWAGICGELGADTTLTETFLRMGVDELSVAPASILPIRKVILESSTS